MVYETFFALCYKTCIYQLKSRPKATKLYMLGTCDESSTRTNINNNNKSLYSNTQNKMSEFTYWECYKYYLQHKRPC